MVKRIAWLAGALGTFVLPLAGEAGTLTPLYAVPGHVDGASPGGPLVRVGTRLFGTSGGGLNGCGAIFSIDPRNAAKGNRDTIVYSFTCKDDGGSPVAGLAISGGKLFGTTGSGGASNGGTVFEIDPATGAETTVFAFPYGANSSHPLLAYDGLLYGTLSQGGDLGRGLIFSVDPAAMTERTVYSFTGEAGDGNEPSGQLLRSGDKLYGLAFKGGVDGNGALFALNPATGAVKTLYSFMGGADGAAPEGPLTDVGGVLYGTTVQGGGSMNGVVFAFDLHRKTETVTYRFTGGDDGSLATNGVIAVNGLLYGTTGSAGQFHYGTLFSLNPVRGAEKTLFAFKTTDGIYASGSLVENGGKLYGAQAEGGPGPSATGVIYAFDLASSRESAVHVFANPTEFSGAALVQAGGEFYGTSAAGGTAGLGSIFKLDRTTGIGKVVHSFQGQSDGIGPLASLVGSEGLFYGTTSAGGALGGGTVFRFDPIVHSVTTLYAFSGGADGGTPKTKLTVLDGAIYGTTAYGGTNDVGTVFKVDPSGPSEVVLHNFGSGQDGRYPASGLASLDGLLYGTTASGGAGFCGILYSIDPVSGTETTLHAFEGGSEGCYPVAADLLVTNGLLYGSTNGGRRIKATVFAADPASGTETVVHAFPSYVGPTSQLVATRGKLYGLMDQGGGSRVGSLIRIDLGTGHADNEYSFTNGADGRFPGTSLLYVDGAFYGTSSLLPNAGLVFRFQP